MTKLFSVVETPILVFNNHALIIKNGCLVFRDESLEFRNGSSVFKHQKLVFKNHYPVFKHESFVLKNKSSVFKHKSSVLKNESLVFGNKSSVVQLVRSITINISNNSINLKTITMSDFIPRSDGNFNNWQKNLLVLVAENATLWEIPTARITDL